jgi:hypothetical protein
MKAADLESLNSRKRDRSAEVVAMSPKDTKTQASSLSRGMTPSGDGTFTPNLAIHKHIRESRTMTTTMKPYLLCNGYTKREVSL